MYLLLKKSCIFQDSSHGVFFFNRKGGDFFLGFMKKLGFFRWGIARSRSWAKMATTRLTGALGMLALVEVGTHRVTHHFTGFQVKCRGIFSAKILSPDLSPKKESRIVFSKPKPFLFSVFFFYLKLRGCSWRSWDELGWFFRSDSLTGE